LIPASLGGHNNQVLSDPILQKLVPWFAEADRIVEAYIDQGPAFLSAGNYWHRVKLTDPLDNLLFDAFYEFGGHRLACVDANHWELTGCSPAPLVEQVTEWLETSQRDGDKHKIEVTTCLVRPNPKARELPALLQKLR